MAAPSISVSISDFSSNSITLQIILLSDGGQVVNSIEGFLSTGSNPVSAYSQTDEILGPISEVTSSILFSGLDEGTLYYLQATATNSGGTTTSTVVSQTTGESGGEVNPPFVFTLSSGTITSGSIVANGRVKVDGGAAVIERGFAYSTVESAPTVANSSTASTGGSTGTYSIEITDLNTGSLYYLRAYACNSAGVGYGGVEQAITHGPPTLNGITIGTRTCNSAELSGSVYCDGGEAITSRGFYWGTSIDPGPGNCYSCVAVGSGTGSFDTLASSLTPGETYYARSFAINSVGTSYSTQQSFTTCATCATVEITAITCVTSIAARICGDVSNSGGCYVSSRGVYYGLSPNPSTTCVLAGSGTGTFCVDLSGLSSNTTYYARAFAVNSCGTSYGSNCSFYTAINTCLGRMNGMGRGHVGSINEVPLASILRFNTICHP